MADKQKKLEVVPPAEELEEMPLPSDPKVVFLGVSSLWRCWLRSM
jgi:hypothetical protein